MEKLKLLLYEFNSITKEIILSLESENYDNLDKLFNSRFSIIEALDKLEYEREDFMLVCVNLKLIETNTRLEKLMNEKLDLTKEELKKISLNKSVNKNYHKNNYVDSIFFNKKI